MAQTIRCPGCRKVLAAPSGPGPARCPACKTKLPAASPNPPAAGPKPRKRPRPQPQAGFDFVRLGIAAAVALLLMGVSLAVAAGVRFAVDHAGEGAVVVNHNPGPPAPGPDIAVPGPTPPTRPVSAPPPQNVPYEAPRPEATVPVPNVDLTFEPEPPPQWSVAAEAGLPLEPLPTALDVEAGEVFFSRGEVGEVGVVSLRRKEQPRPRLAVVWTRYNLRKEQRLGPETELWSSFKGSEDEKGEPPAGWARAAVHPVGGPLALRDPAAPNRVDVWDQDGNRRFGLLPYGNERIEWLGWTSSGQLLTLGAGKLSAWSLADGKRVYEVEGGYMDPAALSPHWTFAAVPARDHFDLLETRTGRCLGRVKVLRGEGLRWRAVTVSPDGLRLAAVGESTRNQTLDEDGLPVRPAGRQSVPTERVVHTWDLATGQPTTRFEVRTLAGAPLHWVGKGQLLMAGSSLVDLEERDVVRRTEPPPDLVPGSPDGQVWYRATSQGPNGPAVTLRVWAPPDRP